MLYIHNSMLICHGNLKSSNCVVTSRWMLQVTDFGLNEMRHCAENDSIGEHQYYRSKPYFIFFRFILSHFQNPLFTSTITNLTTLFSTQVCFGKHRSFCGIQTHPLRARRKVIYTLSPSFSTRSSGGKALSGQLATNPKVCNKNYAFRCIDLISVSSVEIIELVKRYPQEGEEPFRPDLSLLTEHRMSCSDEYVLNCIKDCWAENPEHRPDFATIRTRLKKMKDGK